MHLYVRINKYYIATVRSLSDFEHYLRNVNDTDETFGEITEIREASDVLVSRVYRMIKRHKALMNQKYLGSNVLVHRNQSNRYGRVIAVTDDRFLIEYEMPNGKKFLNVLSDISKPDRYKSITFKKALHSDAFGEQLNNRKK